MARRQRRELVQQKQKTYYDRSSHSLAQLEKGECVRVEQEKMWKPAVVVEKANTPRSYIVETPEGRRYRRNRSQLLKTKEQSSWRSREDEMEPNAEVTGEKLIQTHIENPGQERIEQKEMGGAPEDDHYVTRSGRLSKPPQRFFPS